MCAMEAQFYVELQRAYFCTRAVGRPSRGQGHAGNLYNCPLVRSQKRHTVGGVVVM